VRLFITFEHPRRVRSECQKNQRLPSFSRFLSTINRLIPAQSGVQLEATERPLCSAMHHAGATDLGELSQFPAPAAEQRSISCSLRTPSGGQELRSKPVLTAVGEVSVSRLLPVPALPLRTVLRRPRTGYRKDGVLSPSAPHARPSPARTPPSIVGTSN
jgi:hypothetical protein